jgi:hypothetical protein
MYYCSPGFYCPVQNLRSPLPCPGGYFCPTMETLSPTVCPIGFVCPAGSSSPNPCHAGTYCNRPGLVAFGDLCPPGYHCPVGVSAPTNVCPAGSFCPEATGLPLPCSAGTFCPQGSSAQIECPPGTYCPPQSTAPVPCDEGKWCGVAGMHRSKECLAVAGYYCDAAITKPCPVGSSCPGNGTVLPCSEPDLCPQIPGFGLMAPLTCLQVDQDKGHYAAVCPESCDGLACFKYVPGPGMGGVLCLPSSKSICVAVIDAASVCDDISCPISATDLVMLFPIYSGIDSSSMPDCPDGPEQCLSGHGGANNSISSSVVLSLKENARSHKVSEYNRIGFKFEETDNAHTCPDEQGESVQASCYGSYNIPSGMYLPVGAVFPIECGQGFLCEHGRRLKCRSWTQSAGSRACAFVPQNVEELVAAAGNYDLKEGTVSWNRRPGPLFDVQWSPGQNLQTYCIGAADDNYVLPTRPDDEAFETVCNPDGADGGGGCKANCGSTKAVVNYGP